MLLSNYTLFLDNIFRKLEDLGIDVSNYELDHFGYQTDSKEDYEKLLPRVQAFSKRISEDVVGGRRVSVFELETPLHYKNRTISAIELVEPKEGQMCPSALNHAEFVIKESFDQFLKKYPEIEFDTSKIDQKKFPMITLDVDKNIQVKFHLKNVLEIVK